MTPDEYFGQSRFRRYAVAVVLSIAVLVACYLLRPALEHASTMQPLLFAIILSAWYGGTGPALLATLLTTSISFVAFAPAIPLWSKLGTDAVVLALFLGQAGLVVLLMASLREIAARVQAGAQEFRVMFELSASGNGQVDLQTRRYLRTNPKFSEITGYSAEELKRLTPLDLTHPDDRVADWELFQRALRGEVPEYCNEKRYIRKDGSIIWVYANARSIPDTKGGSQRTIGSIVDVTERHESETKLKESETRFRQLAETIRDVFWIAEHGHLVYISPGYEEVWGRSQASLYADLMSLLQSVHPDDRSKITEGMERNKLGERTTIEYRILHPDGSTRWICDRGYPVMSSEGPSGRVVGIAEDITDRKKILDQLASAKDEADAANHAKSLFLASMSHEIRTPLTAISGFAELLSDLDVPRDMHARYAATIRRNVAALTRLIDDILDLSKVEVGKLEIEKLRIDLPALLDDVMTTMAAKAQQKKIHLTTTFDAALPERIFSDPTRLRQILVNIIGNAIKFTDAGSVSVRVSSPLRATGPRLLQIVVVDTGHGISEVERERLFQPFTQGRRETARLFGGTGLGLDLSRKLARMLGGDLVIGDSAVGRGSTFIITIDPGVVSGMLFADSMKGLDTPSLFVQSKDGEGELAGLNILLVEDGIDNQDLIQCFLCGCGAQVEVARTGREGIEQALAGEHDLVLMDVQLPEINGREATKLLRAQGYRVPIIALTASAMADDRQRSLRDGCDEHLAKPIHRATLVRTVARYAALRRQGQASVAASRAEAGVARRVD